MRIPLVRPTGASGVGGGFGGKRQATAGNCSSAAVESGLSEVSEEGIDTEGGLGGRSSILTGENRILWHLNGNGKLSRLRHYNPEESWEKEQVRQAPSFRSDATIRPTPTPKRGSGRAFLASALGTNLGRRAEFCAGSGARKTYVEPAMNMNGHGRVGCLYDMQSASYLPKAWWSWMTKQTLARSMLLFDFDRRPYREGSFPCVCTLRLMPNAGWRNNLCMQGGKSCSRPGAYVNDFAARCPSNVSILSRCNYRTLQAPCTCQTIGRQDQSNVGALPNSCLPTNDVEP